MKLLSKLSILLILFSLMACTEPSMKRIDMMEKQISIIENKFQKTENAFDNLVEDCIRLDEFLRNDNNPKPEMQLVRAYLQQYEDERVVLLEEIEYSKSQLRDLKDDFKKGLYSETQREEYLASEEKAVNTINAKLDYFIDRLEKQSVAINDVVKQ